jgi:Do/DeqQ family serine protease
MDGRPFAVKGAIKAQRFRKLETSSMTKRTALLTSPLALAVALALGCQAGAKPAAAADAPNEAQAPAENPPPAQPRSAAYDVAPTQVTVLDQLPEVAESAVKSVVNISSTRVARPNPMMQDPFFRHFFGQRPMPERKQQSLGSGVIVREDGVILTNNHVVQDAEEITVNLSDEREYEAEVIGTDPESDLAVIKLEEAPKDLVPLRFGDSGELRLGETVLAIGNPFGVGQTVTMGIVSATGRANVGIVDYEDFIQTDAAINPGNSGGALVNMKGELVGINTAILSRTGGYQGIGFAIPSNMAKTLMLDLLDDGRVSRGFLGVMIQDLTPELARAFGMDDTEGVLVSQVMDGSPAEAGGIRTDDVIVSVDGKAVDSAARLRLLIAAKGAAQDVKIGLIRDGEKKTVTVELGEKAREGPAVGGEAPSQPQVGLRLAPLDNQVRQQFDIEANVDEGAVIVDIAPGSPAARAGLRPGDVIVEVNRKRVDGPRAASRAISKSEGNILLRVVRGTGAMYVVIDRG